MPKCKNYKTGESCPELYYCKDEGDMIQAGTSMKHLDRYCFYCLATARVKKIGHSASWPGSTPKWCPLGRDK